VKAFFSSFSLRAAPGVFVFSLFPSRPPSPFFPKAAADVQFGVSPFGGKEPSSLFFLNLFPFSARGTFALAARNRTLVPFFFATYFPLFFPVEHLSIFKMGLLFFLLSEDPPYVSPFPSPSVSKCAPSSSPPPNGVAPTGHFSPADVTLLPLFLSENTFSPPLAE